METGSQNIDILVIEDNPGDYLLIESCLFDQFPYAKINNSSSFSEAVVFLNAAVNKPDIVFLDLSLPDMAGEQLIAAVIGLQLEIPIIVLTGYSDFNFGIKSLTLGVSDYLLKDEINPGILAKSIYYSLEREKQYIKLKHSQDDFRSLFYLSPTGMWIIDIETLKVIDANIAALEIFGFFKDVFQTKSLSDILAPAEFEDFKNSFLINVDNTTATYSATVKYQNANGGTSDLEIKSKMIEYQGKHTALILTDDITEKQYQLNEIKNQNKKLSDIAWLQSHIVRAPLSRILGLCQLIETFDEFKKNKDLGQMIKYLNKSANDLDNAIKKIITRSANHNEFKNDFVSNIEN